MLELIKLRAQMLSGNLPVDEMKDVKLKATSEIDTGNKLLGKFSQRGRNHQRQSSRIVFIN